MQRDDELWELLISLALESPALTGMPVMLMLCLCLHGQAGHLGRESGQGTS